MDESPLTMSLSSPSDRYRVVLTADCDFRAWRESEPLSHDAQEFAAGTWATRAECEAAIEKLWQRRRQFSTGREYACWGSFCRCTSHRPGYCCAGCKFQASVENDPDRPLVKAECPCDHAACGKAAEMVDPREALEKMRAAPLQTEDPERERNESFWAKVKRSWAEAGKEEKDGWVREA